MATTREPTALDLLLGLALLTSAYVGAYVVVRIAHLLVHHEIDGGSASEANTVRAGDGSSALWELPFVPLMRFEELVWYLG